MKILAEAYFLETYNSEVYDGSLTLEDITSQVLIENYGYVAYQIEIIGNAYAESVFIVSKTTGKVTEFYPWEGVSFIDEYFIDTIVYGYDKNTQDFLESQDYLITKSGELFKVI